MTSTDDQRGEDIADSSMNTSLLGTREVVIEQIADLNKECKANNLQVELKLMDIQVDVLTLLVNHWTINLGLPSWVHVPPPGKPFGNTVLEGRDNSDFITIITPEEDHVCGLWTPSVLLRANDFSQRISPEPDSLPLLLKEIVRLTATTKNKETPTGSPASDTQNLHDLHPLSEVNSLGASRLFTGVRHDGTICRHAEEAGMLCNRLRTHLEFPPPAYPSSAFKFVEDQSAQKMQDVLLPEDLLWCSVEPQSSHKTVALELDVGAVAEELPAVAMGLSTTEPLRIFLRYTRDQWENASSAEVPDSVHVHQWGSTHGPMRVLEDLVRSYLHDDNIAAAPKRSGLSVWGTYSWTHNEEYLTGEPRDPAKGLGEVNHFVGLLVYLCQRLSFLTSWCPACLDPLPAPSLKILPCSDPMCRFQFEELGTGSSVLWEVRDQQGIVDLEVDLALAASATSFKQFPSFLQQMSKPQARARAVRKPQTDPVFIESEHRREIKAPCTRSRELPSKPCSSSKDTDKDVGKMYFRFYEGCGPGNLAHTLLSAVPEPRVMAECEQEAALTQLIVQSAESKLARRASSQSALEDACSEEEENRPRADLAYKLLRYVLCSNPLVIKKLPKSEWLPGLGTSRQYAVLLDHPERELSAKMFNDSNKTFFAFHGSPFRNWYSIMRSGLKSLTPTPRGMGLYVAKHLVTAASHCVGDKRVLVAVVEVPYHDSVEWKDNNAIVPEFLAEEVIIRYILEFKCKYRVSVFLPIDDFTIDGCFLSKVIDKEPPRASPAPLRRRDPHPNTPPESLPTGEGNQSAKKQPPPPPIEQVDLARHHETLRQGHLHQQANDLVYRKVSRFTAPLVHSTPVPLLRTRTTPSPPGRRKREPEGQRQLKRPITAESPMGEGARGGSQMPNDAGCSVASAVEKDSLWEEYINVVEESKVSADVAMPNETSVDVGVPRGVPGFEVRGSDSDASNTLAAETILTEFSKLMVCQSAAASCSSSLPPGTVVAELLENSNPFWWRVLLLPQLFNPPLSSDLRQLAVHRDTVDTYPEGCPIELEVIFTKDFPFEVPFFHIADPPLIVAGDSYGMEKVTFELKLATHEDVEWASVHTLGTILAEVVDLVNRSGVRVDLEDV